MASYKGHACGGLIAYAAVTGLLVFAVRIAVTRLILVEWLLCALIGSLFPDIDIKSKGQRLVYSLLLLLSITFIVAGNMHCALAVATCALIPPLARHRGMCHRWWFAGGVALVIVIGVSYFFPLCTQRCLYDVLFFLAGFASHLALDRRVW